jgi:hypothetical protein
METARVWTTDVDNADEAVDFFVIVSQWLSHGQDRLPSQGSNGILLCLWISSNQIEFLPKTIADTLCNKNAQGFVWIVPESKEHCIIPLMQLCSGSLLNTPKEVVQDGGFGSLLNSAKEVVDIHNDLDNASNGGGSSNNVFLRC